MTLLNFLSLSFSLFSVFLSFFFLHTKSFEICYMFECFISHNTFAMNNKGEERWSLAGAINGRHIRNIPNSAYDLEVIQTGFFEGGRFRGILNAVLD